MARIRFLAFVAPALILAFTLLPATRWLMARQWDWLTGGFSAPGQQRMLNPHLWKADTPDQQLIQAYDSTFGAPGQRMNLKPLRDYCRAHPDNLVAWAFLTRRASTSSGPAGLLLSQQDPQARPGQKLTLSRRKLPPAEYDVLLAQVTETSDAMLEGAVRGEVLDKDNAYSPAMAAAAQVEKGDPDAARKELAEAARRTKFKDYALQEGFMRIDAIEHTWGFRGYAQRLNSYATIIYPHLLRLKEMARICWTPDHQPIPDAQRDMTKLTKTMVKEGDTMITLLVGIAMENIALVEPSETKSRGSEEQRRVTHFEAAEAADKRDGGSTFANTMKEFQGYTDRIKTSIDAADGTAPIDSESNLIQAPGPPVILIAELSVLTSGTFLLWLSRRKLGSLAPEKLAKASTRLRQWQTLGLALVPSLVGGYLAMQAATGLSLIIAVTMYLGLVAILAWIVRPSQVVAWALSATVGVVLAVVFAWQMIAQLRHDHEMEAFTKNILSEVDRVRP